MGIEFLPLVGEVVSVRVVSLKITKEVVYMTVSWQKEGKRFVATFNLGVLE